MAARAGMDYPLASCVSCVSVLITPSDRVC